MVTVQIMITALPQCVNCFRQLITLIYDMQICGERLLFFFTAGECPKPKARRHADAKDILLETSEKNDVLKIMRLL